MTTEQTDLPIAKYIKGHIRLCENMPDIQGYLEGMIKNIEPMEEAQQKKANDANEFIKDIAKLFGEDDLGNDGKTWSIDDFSEAIQKAKEEEMKRIVGIANEILSDCEAGDDEKSYYERKILEKFITRIRNI